MKRTSRVRKSRAYDILWSKSKFGNGMEEKAFCCNLLLLPKLPSSKQFIVFCAHATMCPFSLHRHKIVWVSVPAHSYYMNDQRRQFLSWFNGLSPLLNVYNFQTYSYLMVLWYLIIGRYICQWNNFYTILFIECCMLSVVQFSMT